MKFLIILQLFVMDVTAIQWRNGFYTQVSPEKVFNTRFVLDEVIEEICDSSLVGTQHFEYYGCRVPYFQLNCDIVKDGKAYYMNKEDYLNDKSSIKNLTE